MRGSVESKTEAGAKSSGMSRAKRLQTLGACVVALGILLTLVWPKPNAEAVWTLAKTAFEARDFPEADRHLKQLSKLREPTTLDWMLRAQVAMGMNRDPEAFEDLKHVPDDHPMAASARLQMGQMELRRNRFMSAETYLLQSLKLDPNRIQARRELIYIYGIQLRRGDLNAAFRVLSEQSALTYSEVFLWCLSRGVVWEPEEIVKTLAKAIEADPNDRWARLGRAQSLVDLNRYDEAEATLSPLPESDPDARAVRVRLALARGDDLGAETLLDTGPEDHLGLALLRGQLALARGNPKAALHHYRIAYKKAPYQREAVFGLGKALQITGDPTASTYLEQARKLDVLSSLVQKASVQANRNDPILIRDLGAACAAVGRLPEARAWYHIAIARDLLDTKAQQALARLGEPEPAPTAPH